VSTNKLKENKALYTAALILLIYGIAEAGDCVFAFLITLGAVPTPGFNLTFVFPALQEIWTRQPLYMLLIFLVFTSLRIASALGMLKNRLWGWWLGMISSVLTLAVMTLFLPFGALDGIITVPVLVLLLTGYFRDKPISE
jgi:hypothetical protein